MAYLTSRTDRQAARNKYYLYELEYFYIIWVLHRWITTFISGGYIFFRGNVIENWRKNFGGWDNKLNNLITTWEQAINDDENCTAEWLSAVTIGAKRLTFLVEQTTEMVCSTL